MDEHQVTLAAVQGFLAAHVREGSWTVLRACPLPGPFHPR